MVPKYQAYVFLYNIVIYYKNVVTLHDKSIHYE